MPKYRIVIDGLGTTIEAKDEQEAQEIGKRLAIQNMRVERVKDDAPTTKEVL